MAECFSVEEAALRSALEHRFGCVDVFSDADDLNRLLSELAEAGILRAPSGLEILIYPSAAAESDVALVTVFSTRCPNAHVAGISAPIGKMASRELWEGDDPVARTVEIVESVLDTANAAIPAVRQLERLAPIPADAIADARCPNCGEASQLRVEYRYDICGVGPDRALILGDGELTDIFCLACGEEVEDVLGSEDAPLDGHEGGGLDA
jgi:hypothetical protein